MLGGVETYSRMLIESLNKNYLITEFPIINTGSIIGKKMNVKTNYLLTPKKEGAKENFFPYSRKKMKTIYEEFDLVILNVPSAPRYWIEHKKSILIQHFNREFYKLHGKFKDGIFYPFGFFFNSTLMGVGTLNNQFKNANNSVFYTRESRLETKGNSYFVPLCRYSSSEIKSFKNNPNRKGFIWFARLSRQKGIDNLIKIANENKDVEIFGSGKYERKLGKSLINANKVNKPINFKDVSNTLPKYKAMLMTSKTEGFGYTVVEALSTGTPVILFDTFDAAKFLGKCEAVFLIKEGDVEGYNNAMNHIRRLSAKQASLLSKKAKEFAIKNLSSEEFKSKWLKILRNIHI